MREIKEERSGSKTSIGFDDLFRIPIPPISFSSLNLPFFKNTATNGLEPMNRTVDSCLQAVRAIR